MKNFIVIVALTTTVFIGLSMNEYLYLWNRFTSVEKQARENKLAIHSLQEEMEDLKQKVNSLLPRTVTVTAYTARKKECDSTPDKNAIMERPRAGTIAVSRDLHRQGWSLGKRVYIDQVGVYRIADLMHPRWENKIDVLLASVKEARRFGVKESTAVLLD